MMPAVTRLNLPSRPQAAVLSCLLEHRDQGESVMVPAGQRKRGEKAPHRVLFVVERFEPPDYGGVKGPLDIGGGLVDYEPGPGRQYLHPASLEYPLRTTVQACVNRGFIDVAENLYEVHTALIGRAWLMKAEWVKLQVLELTDLGEIALGIWRQKQLAAPSPAPTLEGKDREIVEVAERARALGLAVVPMSDGARKAARRLRREGWISRGHVSASATSIVPSPLGLVEVNPAAADTVIP